MAASFISATTYRLRLYEGRLHPFNNSLFHICLETLYFIQ